MAWTDRLTSDDEETLLSVRQLHGIRAWELYVVIGLQIRLDGPLGRETLSTIRDAWGGDVWAKIAKYFELRGDGNLHLQGALS